MSRLLTSRADFTDDELRSYEQIERNEHRDLKNTCLPDDLIFNAPPSSDTRELLHIHTHTHI